MSVASSAERPAVSVPGWRSHLKRVRPTTILKLGFTVGLSALLLSQNDMPKVLQTLRGADKNLVLLAVSLAAGAMVINVSRWRLMLRAQAAHASLTNLIRLYLIGMFFSNFLPSRMGGDVVRAYGVSMETTTKTRSAAAVLMDRLVGAISVLALAVLSISIGASRLPEGLRWSTVAVFVLSAVILALMLYRNDQLANLRLRVLARSDVSILGLRVRPRLESALNALRTYSRSPVLVGRGFLISLVANGVSMLNLYLYARAVRADVGLGDVATIAPFILAVGLVPVSFNGLGTVELTFQTLFGLLGVDADVGLAIAILRRLSLILLSIVGGFLYALRRFS